MNEKKLNDKDDRTPINIDETLLDKFIEIGRPNYVTYDELLSIFNEKEGSK